MRLILNFLIICELGSMDNECGKANPKPLNKPKPRRGAIKHKSSINSYYLATIQLG
jgi:hypothetical protein